MFIAMKSATGPAVTSSGCLLFHARNMCAHMFRWPTQSTIVAQLSNTNVVKHGRTRGAICERLCGCKESLQLKCAGQVWARQVHRFTDYKHDKRKYILKAQLLHTFGWHDKSGFR